MKKCLILIFIILPIITFGGNKPIKREVKDYSFFMMGVEAGASILLGIGSNSGLTTKFKLSGGGLIILRPVDFISLETGFKYHYILSENSFFDIPLLLHFYNKKNQSLILGPNLIYNIVNKETDFSSPLLGATLGFGNNYSGIYFSWYPSYSDFFTNDLLKNGLPSFLFAVSIRFRYMLIFPTMNIRSNQNSYKRRTHYI